MKEPLDSSLDIYVVAIGGTGMAPLACLLQELGHRVRGVDEPLYPPMSTLLADAGIEPLVGYDAAHLDGDHAQRASLPDLIIIGNAVPRTNPEAETAEKLRSGLRSEDDRDDDGVPILSMPEALSRFLLEGRRPLVAAGTHGKTTTSAMAAWTLHRCGRDPGWLVGGIPRNLERSFAVGVGERFVVEGDEYNAAYFDRGPKFLHYRPHTLILTSVEHDHADLYPCHEDLLARYRQLVALVPSDGLVIACGDGEGVEALARSAASGNDGRGARIVTYGLDPTNDVYPVDLRMDADGSHFRVGVSDALTQDQDPDLDLTSGEVRVHLRVAGEHNLQNALGVWVAARFDGISSADVAEALGAFRGAKRRLEELGTSGGVTVVDDFAHHPTAVAKSLGGLRQRYPDRRAVLCYEPRSLTAGRAFFTDSYRDAFAGADVVHFAPLAHEERLREEGHDVLDLGALVRDLRGAGVEADIAESTDDLLHRVVREARPGDVVATMSSGSFDGLPQRLLQAFRDSATETRHET